LTALPTGCFHCGEALGSRTPLRARVGDSDVLVCCPGCRAAAQLIAELRLEDFYRFRKAPAPKPVQPSEDWVSYDEPSLIEALTRAEPQGRAVMLMVDGLTCAACSWLITRVLQQMDGIVQVSVNTATGRARVVWDDTRVKLSRLLRVIAELGYRPQIVTAENADAFVQAERRSLLKRLAVAGLGMMQVMMFAVAMYAGDAQGMESDVRAYLRLVSLLVATPVMLYGGWPYFSNAAHAVARRSITMDVPVSLALILAYGASVFNTWRHTGEVYFDSVTMFIFFLTVARYVEMVARHQSTRVSDSLSRMLPVTAHRMSTGDAADAVGDVAVAQLKAGDRLLVRAGEVVPADGELEFGTTQFDESMLTGESSAVERVRGDRVTAGAINLGSPVQMRVTAAGNATVLASIVALLNRAQSDRPRITRAADRMASRFLALVMAGAGLVGAFWWLVEPARAFAATLAVLVVACPCAFSLATLVAVASANTALAKRGVLVTNPDAVESLTKVTRVIFDKTGTLTKGIVSVSCCTPLGQLSAGECLEIASALEFESEHPIAQAFAAVPRVLRAGHVRVIAGGGVAGTVDGKRYRIGTRAFVTGEQRTVGARRSDGDDAVIVLAGEGGELATFALDDTPRPESVQAVEAIHKQGLSTEILSGDSLAAVSCLARHCGIAAFAARQSPADKLERVNALTRAGEFIAMVGDGINDAPVLGGAGVSIAMSRGSALTLASADLILAGDSLRALPDAFRLARRATRVIRQNLLWSAGYNLIAMPLAALGWVPPWAAAIGMSSSSILVVLNSLRLMRAGPLSARRKPGSRSGAAAIRAGDAQSAVP
jgi:P-type Cu2+ transporter